MGAVETIRRAKQLARCMAAELYAKTPGFLRSLRGKVIILMYHRVITADEVSRQFIQPGMYVTTETFEHHVRFLHEHFVVLSFNELLGMWRERAWDPERRYAVITFDDGWLDTYQHAWPLLQRHHAPAVVFLPTDYVGTDRWFWPDLLALLLRSHGGDKTRRRADRFVPLQRKFPWLVSVQKDLERRDADAVIETFKTRPQKEIDACLAQWAESLAIPDVHERAVMNWEEAGRMSAAGIEFGSHSKSHRIMTALSREEIVREVTESIAILQRRGLRTIPVFCYPNGTWDLRVAEEVEAAGYRAAVTTEFGYEQSPPQSRFMLKRINVHQDITCHNSLFAYHLAGWNHIGPA